MRKLLFVFALLFVVLLLDAFMLSRSYAQIPAQSQAAAVAVPEAPPANIASALVLVQCNKVIGVVIVDTEGGLHPVPLEGMPKSTLDKLMSLVPPWKAIQATATCGVST